MKFQGYIIIVLMALVYTTLGAQDVLVRAMLDTNKALIGDQIKLHLKVEKPASGWKVLFPALKDSITGKIEIIKVSPVDTTTEKPGRQFLNQDVIIAVFDTGFFEIPSLPFMVRVGERTDTLNTLPVGFEVLSVKTGNEIRDIKAIYKVPVSLRELAPYILLLVAVGLLVWLLMRYVKNRNKVISRTANKMIAAEPSDVIALRDLEKLRDEKLWLNNKIKLHYIRISDILRVYIGNRFKTPALEQTTEEILESLKSPVCETTELNRLSVILKLADLVKFAKVRPDTEENALQIDKAAEFVRNTSLHNEPEVTAADSETVLDQSKISS